MQTGVVLFTLAGSMNVGVFCVSFLQHANVAESQVEPDDADPDKDGESAVNSPSDADVCKRDHSSDSPRKSGVSSLDMLAPYTISPLNHFNVVGGTCPALSKTASLYTIFSWFHSCPTTEHVSSKSK